jgi:hypothetical protein
MLREKRSVCSVHHKQEDQSRRVSSRIDFDILHPSTDTRCYAIARTSLVYLNPDGNANDNTAPNPDADKDTAPNTNHYFNSNNN